MKSFLFSALVTRYRDAGAQALAKDHACDWLLWEPGAWKPPGVSTIIAKAAPPPEVPLVPTKEAEALALALPAGPQATLGRGEGCDLVINDGTLSMVHLRFRRGTDGSWQVEDAGSRNGTALNGRKLEAGRLVPLVDGSQLVLASQVVLTFYTPRGLWGRLRGPRRTR